MSLFTHLVPKPVIETANAASYAIHVWTDERFRTVEIVGMGSLSPAGNSRVVAQNRSLHCTQS